jgi:hypothetical protein
MMDISTLANLINAIAVTAGVIFAATQIRDYRRQRKRDAMLALVRSFQSPTFAKALRRISARNVVGMVPMARRAKDGAREIIASRARLRCPSSLAVNL